MKLPDSLGGLLRRLPLAHTLPGRAEKVLLELDLGRGVAETGPANPVEAVRSLRTPQLRTLIEHLRRAQSDDTVVGLIAAIPGHGLTLAQTGELRAAVAHFRQVGKPTVAWSASFGELTQGTTGYHLAAGFDEIWLQPSGGLGLVGFAASATFLRGAFDKVGVEPQFGQRHEYKSAADTFVKTGLTAAHREMLTRLVDSATDIVVADVARDRGMDPATVRDAIESSPLTAAQALDRGLVDRIGYRDQAYASIRERCGTDQPTLRYVERHGVSRFDALLEQLPRPGHDPIVAVIPAAGPIHLGHPRSGPAGGHAVGSDSLGAALRAAAKDEHVKAVVLRIDSPGGSYVASDALRRDVKMVRETGRPVVASMASVAASGGYYLAMGCDRIVANAGTLTGSIGVLAGKFVLQGALSRIGLHRDTVAGATNAAMFSTDAPFDDEQLAILERWLDDVYDDFTSKAAADRKLPVEELRAVARGRVWTGADAADRGLVDEVGGLRLAVRRACDLADVALDDVTVVPFPRPHPFAALNPPENSESVAAAAALPAGEGPWLWSHLTAEVARATGWRLPGVLSLPPVRITGLLPE